MSTRAYGSIYRKKKRKKCADVLLPVNTQPGIIAEGSHNELYVFHATTCAESRGSCLNSSPQVECSNIFLGTCKNVNAVKQTCVIAVLAFWKFHLKASSKSPKYLICCTQWRYTSKKKKRNDADVNKNRQNAFSMALTSYHVTLRKQAKTCSDMCPFVHGFKQIYALILCKNVVSTSQPTHHSVLCFKHAVTAKRLSSVRRHCILKKKRRDVLCLKQSQQCNGCQCANIVLLVYKKRYNNVVSTSTPLHHVVICLPTSLHRDILCIKHF